MPERRYKVSQHRGRRARASVDYSYAKCFRHLASCSLSNREPSSTHSYSTVLVLAQKSGRRSCEDGVPPICAADRLMHTCRKSEIQK
jgi:hypothetical protein